MEKECNAVSSEYKTLCGEDQDREVLQALEFQWNSYPTLLKSVNIIKSGISLEVLFDHPVVTEVVAPPQSVFQSSSLIAALTTVFYCTSKAYHGTKSQLDSTKQFKLLRNCEVAVHPKYLLSNGIEFTADWPATGVLF